jgi:hypothetical protein
LKIPIKTGTHVHGGNPSTFAATKQSGVGMVALNDEFRAHVREMADDGTIILQDRNFVLKPGATYTAQFAIVPIDSPDFWDFVNAARRMLDVNFELNLMFAFAFHKPPVYEWSEQTFRNFIDNKSINFLVQSNYGVRTKTGKPARCTDWLKGPHNVYRDMGKRVRKFYPDHSVRTGIYYHCFLDTTEQNQVKYKDDRALDAAGKQIIYGAGRNSYMSLYIPTLKKGSWGEQIAKVVDVILDDIGAAGIFWDEFSWSTRTFIYSHWDGCSADIDWKTHKIQRKKGSIPLLSRDFRDRMVRRIMDSGAPLMVSGSPWLRSIAKHKFHALTETGSISHCRKMLLYTPLALGDHITEHKAVDSYRVMLRALDHGCLYAWYPMTPTTHKTLTEHMFPITPIEIHSGYIIGKQRIITNRSGMFSWGDTSEFDAYVYDRQGKLTDQYTAKPIMQDGQAYAELRMPEGYSAAIVRR